MRREYYSDWYASDSATRDRDSVTAAAGPGVSESLRLAESPAVTGPAGRVTEMLRSLRCTRVTEMLSRC